MSDLTSRLTARKMPHKDVPLCLDLSLIEQRDAAMRAVDAAARARIPGDDRMVSKKTAATTAAAKQLRDVEAQIAAASITLRITGVDRLTYQEWMLACPPRKGRQEAYNAAKFFMHAAKNSAVYVDADGVEHLISDEEWAHIDKMLTDGEHERIAEAVVHVNRAVGQVDVGFFGNGSGMTTDS